MYLGEDGDKDEPASPRMMVQYHTGKTQNMDELLRSTLKKERNRLIDLPSSFRSKHQDSEEDEEYCKEVAFAESTVAAVAACPNTSDDNQGGGFDFFGRDDFFDDILEFSETSPQREPEKKLAKKLAKKQKEHEKEQKSAERERQAQAAPNFNEKNYATLSLIIQSESEAKRFKFVRTTNRGFAFAPEESPEKEIVCISGCRNATASEGDGFVWTEHHQYTTCLWQAHEEGIAHKKYVAGEFLEMKGSDLFSQLLLLQPKLTQLIKLLESEKSDENYAALFDALKEDVSSNKETDGSREFPVLSRLNSFHCAESTMSRLLRLGFSLPNISEGDSVSLVFGSKWSPCATCANNLDIQCQPLLGALKERDITPRRIFMALDPYSSQARGFKNSERQGSGPWTLLVRKKPTSTKNHSFLTPIKERPEEGMSSRAPTFLSPESADKALAKKDNRLLDQGVQTSPMRNEEQQLEGNADDETALQEELRKIEEAMQSHATETSAQLASPQRSPLKERKGNEATEDTSGDPLKGKTPIFPIF